jgi:hypothetical protein
MVDALSFTPRRRVEERIHGRAALAVLGHGSAGDGPNIASSDDGSRTLVIYGECFDNDHAQRRLERAGCRFRLPASDAELCLRLYEQEGVAGLSGLSGSYAIALFDAGKHELTLVSDRLGTRPLFHATSPDGRFVFATQLSAVLRCAEVPRDLDLDAVLQFCTLQRVLGDRTHHAAVRVVPPASVLTFDGKQTRLSEYWTLRYSPRPGSADDYAEELAAVMKRCARHLHRGGAKAAMLLSGGLDARMVVAASEAPLHCYTFADYFNPEAKAAKEVAEARGFEFTFLQRQPDHYVDLLDRAVEIGGGMYTFNHAHAIGFLDRIAAECDVVTHGFAPELFFRGPNLPRVPRSSLGLEIDDVPDPSLAPDNIAQRILHRSYSLMSHGATALLTTPAARRLDAVLDSTSHALVAQARRGSDNVYDQFLYPDVHYHARYPSMLFEISLRSFMTERSLFFHNDVIDLFLRMPQPLRSDNAVWLKALERLDRKVARAVNANTGHSALMPAGLAATLDAAVARASKLPLAWRWQAARQKAASEGATVGQSPISWPRYDWMIRHHAKLRSIIEATVDDPSALPPEIFDHRKVRALLDEHLAGSGHHRTMLFTLLTFGRWHVQYGGAVDLGAPAA